MMGELADALSGVSTGCQLNLDATLPHVSVTRITGSRALRQTGLRPRMRALNVGRGPA